MLQNAVRPSKILTDFRCFTDTAIFGCSTQTVQSQELIIAAPVTAGEGLVGAYIKRRGKSRSPKDIASDYTWQSIIDHLL